MRQYLILIFCSFLLISCSKVETAPKDFQENLTPSPTVSPTVKTKLLKPITPNIKLNSKQKKYLDESLPLQVREILEKAENFEVLAEVRGKDEYDGEGTTFEPNRIAEITDEDDKKEILETFYKDASTKDSPANCYEPHHSIRATYQGKTIKVEICFSCAKFYVKSEFGNFEGTIVRENRKSENLLNQIIESKSVKLK